MLFGSRRNDRFSVSTTPGTVSVIRRVALCNTPGLSAPGSFNTSPVFKGQTWIFNIPTILLWYTEPPSLGLDVKNPAIYDRNLAEGFLSVRRSWDSIWNSMTDSSSPIQLHHHNNFFNNNKVCALKLTIDFLLKRCFNKTICLLLC